MSNVDNLRETDPAWERQTLFAFISDVASSRPKQTAFVTVDARGVKSRVDYGSFVDRTVAFSAGLADIGVQRGDRVALWMTNLLEWPCAYFAAARIGATVVPVSTWFLPNEVHYVLKSSAAQHLIVLDDFRSISFLDRLAEIVPTWPQSTRGNLADPALPFLRNVVIHSRDKTYAGENAFNFEDLFHAPAVATTKADELAAASSPSDLAMIKFTSGSTSFPKGVLLEQGGIVTVGQLHARRVEVSSDDVVLTQMPFFHAGGSIWGLMTALSSGSTLAFTETKDGDAALRLVLEERCTISLGLSPMQRALLSAWETERPKISWVRAATKPEDPTLERELSNAFGVNYFFSRYGMTEAYGPAAVTGPNDPLEYSTDAWVRPLDGEEIRIVDPATGIECAIGDVGEICMRGLVMRGYHGSKEATAEVIDDDGWLHSQDLGIANDQGYVKWVGRIKTMLKVGGENVSAEEIQDCLREHDLVIDACVIAVPDDYLGEAPRAYVITREGSNLDSSALDAWCRPRLARFKVPREFRFVTELPMTASGKIDRTAVIRLDSDAAQLIIGQA